MKRMIMEKLIKWKESKSRKPLILRGVRQCGKTYILKKFGEEFYENVAYFNFENSEELGKIFEVDLKPKRIIEELGLIMQHKIDINTTLIILDEIQFCSKAITSLKYFAEEMPECNIVCAGSLLGVSLARNLSFPVGKVDFLDLYPLSFKEFLIANGEELICEHLDALEKNDIVPEVIEPKLKGYLQRYYIVGGMPEVVNSWITNKDIDEVELIQQRILDSYQMDFAKHAPINEVPKLSLIWKSIPEQLAKENNKFIFSAVKKGSRANQLEDALEWLIDAGLVYKVTKISMPSIPLSSYSDQSYFKIYLCDVGLLRKMAKLSPEVILTDNNSELYKHFKGSLAENYVLTELISINGKEHYFWRSENKAEIDFVEQIDSHIIPIEVKSGNSVKAKSLSVYRDKFKPDVSVKTSLNNISGNEIKCIPLYMLYNLNKYIK